MSRAGFFALAFAMVLLPFSLPATGPAAAHAQADEYTRAIRSALQELVAGDVRAGRDRLSGLVRQAPQRTAAHCHLASAHRLAGELELALTSFRECTRRAEHSHQKVHQARGLMGTAQTLAQLDRMPEAKSAFGALLAFAEANPAVVDPALVRSRAAAVDGIIAADAAAAEVRTRREARARESAEAEAGAGSGASDNAAGE